jgi:hypothetical protein
LTNSEIEIKRNDRLKSSKALVAWLRSEDAFWEVQGCLEKLTPPTQIPPLDPEGICLWCLVRCREEIRAALIEAPGGSNLAKVLRVLEHERILEIFAKAVSDQDFQAQPHYVRFTLAVVATCLEACNKNPDRNFWR